MEVEGADYDGEAVDLMIKAMGARNYMNLQRDMEFVVRKFRERGGKYSDMVSILCYSWAGAIATFETL